MVSTIDYNFMPKLDDLRLYGPQCSSLAPVETVHTNPWFAVRNRGGFFTTEYKQPHVIVLPIVANHSIVMVRAKRPVIADNTLELPAGSARENETPIAAAARELAEETGIEVSDLSRFVSLPPIAGSPNRTPTLLHIFQVTITLDEFRSKKDCDDEIEGIELLNFDDVFHKIASGNIYVAVPIAVISRYLLLLSVRR